MNLFYSQQMLPLYCARPRRCILRGVKRKHEAVLKRLRKAKKMCQVNEKPECVKTHCRNMIIEPEMTGSVVGVYNGKTFTTVEVKVNMLFKYVQSLLILYYLSIFSLYVITLI